jgi:hypothetical protein
MGLARAMSECKLAQVVGILLIVKPDQQAGRQQLFSSRALT